MEDAWRQTFGGSSDFINNSASGGLVLNAHQRIFIITEGTNERVKTVVRYLRSLNMDIRLLEYRYYQTEIGEEILDIEDGIDTDLASVGLTSYLKSGGFSETELLNKWDAALKATYHSFRDRILQMDNMRLEPKASQASFYGQSRKGRVYICSFGPVKGGASVWIAPSLLQGLLDFDVALNAIQNAVGTQVKIERNPYWTILRFASDATVAARVADLVAEHIIQRIG